MDVVADNNDVGTCSTNEEEHHQQLSEKTTSTRMNDDKLKDDDTTNINDDSSIDTVFDPLLYKQYQSNTNDIVQEGDCVILQFGDGRMIFAYCNYTNNRINFRGKRIETSVKINRRSYLTSPIIGLPYGSILEQGISQLIPLPSGSKLIPEIPLDLLSSLNDNDTTTNVTGDISNSGTDSPVVDSNGVTSTGTKRKSPDTNDLDSQVGISVKLDNRNLVDNNTAQILEQSQLMELKNSGVSGCDIVQAVIKNSITFESKTIFSKAKYVAKKQKKYQPRCRIVRPNCDTVCQLMYIKEPKKICYLRNDTLGQILSYANITAGQQVLVFETCLGLISSSVASRLGGYGAVVSLYSGQQHPFEDMISKFNLSFHEYYCIKFLHSSHIINNDKVDAIDRTKHLIGTTDLPNISIHPDDIELDQLEKNDRLKVQWPCPLQHHTRTYLTTDPSMIIQNEKQQTVSSSSNSLTTTTTTTTENGTSTSSSNNNNNIILNEYNVQQFLIRRSLRFARKVTRETSIEVLTNYIHERQCNSLIIVVKYDPLSTLQQLFPYLASSCPFVIYNEYIEPLCECFHYLTGIEPDTSNTNSSSSIGQSALAINLRLSDTWMREYQILPGRTHPSMSMTQSGGFLLTGIKLHPIHGQNEFTPTEIQDIKDKLGGRRQRHGFKRSLQRNPTNKKENDPTTNMKDRKKQDKKSEL